MYVPGAGMMSVREHDLIDVTEGVTKQLCCQHHISELRVYIL